jgi:ATP-binding cassette subfamily B protein
MKNSLSIAPTSPILPSNPFKFALYFISKFKLGIMAMIFFEAFQATCQIMIPYAVKNFIDTVNKFSEPSLVTWESLKEPMWLFILLSLGILLFSRASGATLVIIGPSLRRKVRQEIYHYLQFHSHRFFMSSFAGTLSNRISEVSMGVNHSLWTVLFDFWPVMISFGVSLFLVSQVNFSLFLFLGGWISIYVIVSFALATRCRKYAKEFAATRSQVSGKIVDAVTNVINSKMFAKLEFERSYLSKYLDKEVTAARKTFWFMEKMRWFQFISTLILQIGIISYALKIWINGEISVGSFSMLTGLTLLIINDARGLSRRFLEFFEYIGNISDGVSTIILPHEIVDTPQAKDIHITKGKIEFMNVSFAHLQQNPIFSNLNTTIYAGQRIGLVGFSGSGKTTFANLILRFFNLKDGKILIDDQDISTCTQDSLRAGISMIPQEPMLFHRSLMENIRYGNIHATDDEVIQAAKHARAHDFIIQHPDGYNALVGERGVKLSGGQRQRIAIARAILKNSPILILDEATSSLDSITEQAIQSGFQLLMKNKTVIVIAHRLSTISHLDRILVFDKGQIIEDGSHEQLLSLGGHYAKLWSMQVGGFLPSATEDHIS